MASTSEVGHAKNVANFQDLITFIDGYGATYNPNKDSLKLPQLNSQYTNCANSLQHVIVQNTLFNNAVNQRMEAFRALRPLATRLVNALEATDAAMKK